MDTLKYITVKNALISLIPDTTFVCHFTSYRAYLLIIRTYFRGTLHFTDFDEQITPLFQATIFGCFFMYPAPCKMRGTTQLTYSTLHALVQLRRITVGMKWIGNFGIFFRLECNNSYIVLMIACDTGNKIINPCPVFQIKVRHASCKVQGAPKKL